MTIEELAKRKAELKLTLQAIGQCNIYGKNIEELATLELQEINAKKEFFEVENEIKSYIETTPNQPINNQPKGD